MTNQALGEPGKGRENNKHVFIKQTASSNRQWPADKSAS